ncbi:MAG: flagellar export chaperone FliS [Armatimonadota bacterium]|nr:flagellar export chaperone FliS [Armatimonadota bacterium]
MSVAAYQTVDTLTADGPRLVVLLFDGAIQRLELALRALDRRDIVVFAQWLSRAHAIVEALAEALDEARGGELARRLAELYRFALLHLTRALATRDPKLVTEALGVLRPLREGFAAVAGGRP